MRSFQLFKNYLAIIATLALFLVTVVFLNLNGYIPDKSNFTLPEPTPLEESRREDTSVAIKDIEIANHLLYAKDGNLYVLNPETKETTELVMHGGVDYPGILNDGRIYYWKKEGNTYNRLYIQKGKVFEKFLLPLEQNDGSFGVETPPVLAPDGTFIIFTSDRDSRDNYRRRALYHYDLTSEQLTKLTDNTLTTVYMPFISPNGQFIGFTYQNLETNKGALPTALGIIITGTKTVNLYPKVHVSNLTIAFAYDNQQIYFTSPNGVSVFDVIEGKVIADLQTGVFKAIGPDNVIAVEKDTNESELTFWESCTKDKPIGGSKFDNKQLAFYEFKNNAFIKRSSFASSDYFVNLPLDNPYNLFSSDSNAIIVGFQDKDYCDGTKGILSINNGKITPLEEIGRERVFWAADK